MSDWPGQYSGRQSPTTPCPGATHNAFVIATSVFGALSIFGCLAAMLVQYGHSKTRKSLQERILRGVFLASLIFSVGSLVPTQLQSTDVATCGQLKIDSGPTICIFRALWYSGKYAMLFYEVFMIGASIAALRTGRTQLSRSTERVCHLICFVLAVIVFLVFYPLCDSAIASSAAGATTAGGDGSKSSDNQAYRTLVNTMLRGFVVGLGISLLLWIYQRFQLWSLRRQWSLENRMIDRTYDNNPYSQMMAGRRKTLLALQKESYDEIAKPLEPYVLVYMLFGIPAIVMATDYCDNVSLAVWEPKFCDVPCEMMISLRAIAIVVVYFWDDETCAQLFDLAGLAEKVRKRYTEERLRFNEDEDVVIIENRHDRNSYTPRAAEASTMHGDTAGPPVVRAAESTDSYAGAGS